MKMRRHKAADLVMANLPINNIGVIPQKQLFHSSFEAKKAKKYSGFPVINPPL
jgi:hypothetical protein